MNYKDVVQNIDINDKETFGTGLTQCACKNSSFINKDHGHIITGDLRLIENQSLRKIISKGPNYREPKTINWGKCKNVISEGLEKSSEKLAFCDKNVNDDDMKPWKEEILKQVEQKIHTLKRKIKPKKTNPVLKQEEIIRYLENLHKQFVLVPIDKASNNVAIICKRYYVEVVLKEVGILATGNTTYKKTDLTKDEIIDDNVTYSQKLGFKITNNEKELPIMYWTPKFHKKPYGTRFIVASKQCSTKQLSKSVSSAFKLMYNQIENFHKKSKFLQNYNKFWVLQNSDPIIATLDSINKRKNAKSITTYDFSTLYTKLPHDKLIEKLLLLIDFVFEGGNKTFIKISKNGKATWGKKVKNGIGFTKSSLKTAVKHLIENCFFSVGNIILQQIIGIPMGIDPAPFWANLFLYFYEEQFMSHLISSDKIRAKRFHATKRFIDDLCAINDGEEFKSSFLNIYPKELELKLEHSGENATFLNLDITIKDKIFVYKLYDKRDSFPFSIVRMPYLSSNIPQNIFYSALVGEILRIARSTLMYEDFIPKACALVLRMYKQGAQKQKTIKSIRKIIHKHEEDFAKFNQKTYDVINELIIDLN